RLTAVAVFVANTVAPATTPPEGSITVPFTVAPTTWAYATLSVTKAKSTPTTRTRANLIADLFDSPTLMVCLLGDLVRDRSLFRRPLKLVGARVDRHALASTLDLRKDDSFRERHPRGQ